MAFKSELTPDQILEIESAYRNHTRRNKTLDQVQTSSHLVGSQPRQGILTDSIADRHIMAFIELNAGREALALLIHDSRMASDDFAQLVATLEYFKAAGKAIVRGRPETNTELPAVTDRTKKLAENLLISSTAIIDKIAFTESNKPVNTKDLFELPRLILAISLQYHRLSLALLERNAVRLQPGDRPTSPYSDTWPTFERFAREFMEEKYDSVEVNISDVARHSLQRLKDEEPGLRRPKMRSAIARVSALITP